MTASFCPPQMFSEIHPALASNIVEKMHYLHRRPPISFAFGIWDEERVLVGACTFGVPPSRHLQKSVCPSCPDLVIELNRLWVDDKMQRNTESWFVSRALSKMPPRIVVSYADTAQGHTGYIYRALNFCYAGMMDAAGKRRASIMLFRGNTVAMLSAEDSRSACAESQSTAIGLRRGIDVNDSLSGLSLRGRLSSGAEALVMLADIAWVAGALLCLLLAALAVAAYEAQDDRRA